MNLAITGTVGSGKSAVAAMLAWYLDIPLIDTDSVCRELLLPGKGGLQQLKLSFGDTFFTADGALDRGKLREAVFSDPDTRVSLERILHPLVFAHVQDRLQQASSCGEGVLVEVPLLFEVGWQADFDHVVAVYAPDHICIERTIRRDLISREQAEAILALQLTGLEKAERADSVVDNSTIWAAAVLQVFRLARDLRHD